MPTLFRRTYEPQVALWMQETLKSDNAPKRDFHNFMQPILNHMDKQPDARHLCENLRDHSGLIADYGKNYYIFRHKSFLEFLAAQQLLVECREEKERIETLVESFNDDWWEEPLRFFISRSDDRIFDRFMQCLFKAKVSRRLNANKETLLQQLVREAPERKIGGMVQCLNTEESNENQKRYILNCLKIINTPQAVQAVNAFLIKNKGDKDNLSLARDIVAQLGETHGLVTVTAAGSFRNSFEDNVEYIKIPGGSYKFSVSKKMETVPDSYFCKYLVTNKRYRGFIAYLQGNRKDIEEKLPLKIYAEKLREVAKTVKGYSKYLGAVPGEWNEKFCSRLDDEKRFNGDDQPVVAVTWYAARAYCLWLSCLQPGVVYRLPTEVEWEWAAGGREPDGSLREYPWEKSKGKPNPDLANYDENVGATTPVGRYPEGATPEGLMDMAGNAFEWMGNYYNEEKGYPALRGGSWPYVADYLRCVARLIVLPDLSDYYVGFRVVALPSPSHTH
ncbi:MAG: SUMF1/EgtB/PvdO family nonheme iron enzyme [bacterium]|nr:SUMF1/EgtB/PvdO family nonheme iron enzyme [bacterium]